MANVLLGGSIALFLVRTRPAPGPRTRKPSRDPWSPSLPLPLSNLLLRGLVRAAVVNANEPGRHARWPRSANRIVKGPSPDGEATTRMRRLRTFPPSSRKRGGSCRRILACQRPNELRSALHGRSFVNQQSQTAPSASVTYALNGFAQLEGVRDVRDSRRIRRSRAGTVGAGKGHREEGRTQGDQRV